MPYAQALFEAACEAGQEAEVGEDLKEINGILKENPDYVRALAHPKITRAQKQEWLDELFAKGVQPVTARFLELLAHHGMAGRIGRLYEDWNECSRQYHNVETVLVQTPAPLSEKEKADLKAMLEDRLQRTTELTVEIVPELIAGLRVQAKDLVLDNSIRHRLDNLKDKLIESR